MTVSKRIEHILEVIAEVHQAAPEEDRISLRHLRIDAERFVAERHGIAARTVSSQCRRELNLKNIAELDSHLEDWLYSGSNKLKSVVTEHCVSNQDERDVNTFFSERRPIGLKGN